MARVQRSKRWSRAVGAGVGALLLAACGDLGGFEVLPFDPDNPGEAYCSIAQEEIFVGTGGGQDAIPALSDPDLVLPSNPRASFLNDDDRVIGVHRGADVFAIPVKILWYHEIVNMEVAGRALAITHCPLTGSSVAFDRGPVDGAEFGVSGFLYRNNLMMYDRNEPFSLWPQLSFGARCGPRLGTELETIPLVEMTWAAWRDLQPTTFVMTEDTGFDRNYDVDPYGDYAESDDVLFPVELDFRRHIKERVLGVPDASGGVAYPFGELDGLGEVAVVEHDGTTSAEGTTLVFWNRAAQAAMAYSNIVNGDELSFSVVDGEIVDQETGSVWAVDGVAQSGPLAGEALEGVAEAYVAFWFAWAAFNPDAALWEVS